MEFVPSTSQGTIRGSSQHQHHHQHSATSVGTGSQNYSNLNISTNNGSSGQATSSTSMSASTTTAYTFPSGGFNTTLDFSLPPSPRSGALPSPPDSPSSESGSQSGSVSSFPSVSSSFFFSSRAPSPHRSQPSSRYSEGAAAAASRYNTGSGSSGGRSHRRAAGARSRHHSQTYPSSPDENSSVSGRNTSDERELGYGDEFDYGYGDGYLDWGARVNYGDADGVDLIIPSLSLPPALQQPTPYGQTLGDLSVLIVGPRGRGKTALVNYLVWDNADVVDVDAWEEAENGTVLLASTDWVEERDSHGLEQFEGSRNVSFIETWGYNERDPPDAVIQSVLRKIHEPFHELYDALESVSASPLLHSLLASANSPLHTAVIFVCSSPPTFRDHTIMTALAAHIPVITISTDPSSYPSLLQAKLSSFKPPSASALRTGLFRSPQTLALLRGEAADRFLRWREAEQALLGAGGSGTRDKERYAARRVRAQTVRQARASTGSAGTGTGTIRAKRGAFDLTSDSGSNSNSNRAARLSGNERHYRPHITGESHPTHRKSQHRTWNKAQWEAWLSEDVDRRLREAESSAAGKGDQNQASNRPRGIGDMLSGENAYMNAATAGVRELLAESRYQHGPVMDPLHLPSVIALSTSVLSSLQSRAIQSLLRRSVSRRQGGRKNKSKSKSGDGADDYDSEYDVASTDGGFSRAAAFASWLVKWRVELAIVGIFCAGMKLGMMWTYSNEGGVQV